MQAETETLAKEEISLGVDPILKSLSQPRTKDHKSFVQNVLETTPFKVLEWFAPRNLEILTRPWPRAQVVSKQDVEVPEKESIPKEEGMDERKMKTDASGVKNKSVQPNPPIPQPAAVMDQSARERREANEGESDKIGMEKPPIEGPPKPDTKANNAVDPKTYPSHAPRHIPDFHNRRPSHPNTLESQTTTKGVLNLSNSSKLPDTTNDILSLCREPPTPKPKRKLSRQSTTSNPELVGINASVRLAKHLPVLSVQGTKQEISERESVREPAEKPEVRYPVRKSSSSKPPNRLSVGEVPLPQSLPYLSIETINFLCDILQTDGTGENHPLEPRTIDGRLRRHLSTTPILRRDCQTCPDSGYPQSLKKQWHGFIEQSIFDVLSRPDSLLRSFSNEKRILFDTQTIWYLMLRLTRVVPSLVFDSLWVVAGTLFRPPEALETAYDWAKERQHHTTASNKPLSNLEAAQIINICLHALVAAAPLVEDDHSLANLSRFRSFGRRVVDPYDKSEMKMGILSLQYQDIMSDELALRLARRVFAAIPTRRRYAELLELQGEIKSDDASDLDILESILSTFKFLDLATPPLLNFSDQERDLYEKKAPTLILDWARTVMMEDWDGKGEIPADGPFGGALATMTAICENYCPK